MEPRAILFDIDDTLFSTTEFAALARRRSVEALRRFGVRYPVHLLVKELGEVISEFSSNYEQHFNKLLLRLPRRATEGVNPAVLVAAAVAAYHETKRRELSAFPDVIPALRRLSRTDLIRGVITAGLEIKQAEKLIRLGLYEWMTPSAIFISDQIGISKPNPKLYQRACDDMGIRPSDALYVGDSPLSDIDPANASGMVTVLCHRGGRHESERGRTKPRHEIRDFSELLRLLAREYGVREGKASALIARRT